MFSTEYLGYKFDSLKGENSIDIEKCLAPARVKMRRIRRYGENSIDIEKCLAPAGGQEQKDTKWVRIPLILKSV